MTKPIITDLKTIPVAIADDSQLFVEALTALLDLQGCTNITFTVNNGKALLNELAHKQPKVVLMDIRMPEIDGLEATAKVKKLYPDVCVLMLSNYNDLRSVRTALKAGADGYLLKDVDADELQLAIEAVSKGATYFCNEIQKIINLYLSKKPVGSSDYSAVPSIITKTEYEVLLLICEEYTSEEIAVARFISKHTVETHRKNLLLKLDCRFSIGLVKWAIKNNLYHL